MSEGREPAEEAPSPILGLSEATVAPGEFTATGPRPARLPCVELPGAEGDAAVEAFLRTMHPIIMALHSANRTSDFFRTAARAVVEALGMDTGCVLLLRDGRWRSAAHHEAHDPAPDHHESYGPDHDHDPPGRPACWRRSKRLLDRVVREKRTLWFDPGGGGAVGPRAGHGGGCSVVAAPILDRRGEVIGAIYGERAAEAGAVGPRIRKADAMLLEMLAGSVASGLSRLELEKAAVAARVRFEQFFTPELADELMARPDLLTGREVEVTLLFCDLRGFSRVSERVGPARTLEWVGDVLGALSDCVLEHHGVLVDYLGDELIAMWGAPKPARDHARLACRAALAMIDRLPAINARWEPVLGAATDVGVGVNTGPAQVGNTGTSRKFKYGALGNTVNLASRVQGATRYLKTRLVVTGTTRAQLDEGFAARRLGKASVVNIAEPVELHEVVAPGQPRWDEVRRDYEEALSRFEARDFRGATRALGALLAEHPDDGPSLVLMARAVEATVDDPAAFDPVWKLPGK